MIYQFKPGSHLRGDAQKVGEHLDAIRQSQRGLTPEAVVVEARPETSALHPYFEWDDRAAADAYRVGQAGHLIRSVTIVIESASPDLLGIADESPATTIRAFMPVDRDGDRIYEATAVALSNAEYRHQVLERAHAELGAVAQKYRELSELAEVVTAIDKVGTLLGSERLTEAG